MTEEIDHRATLARAEQIIDLLRSVIGGPQMTTLNDMQGGLAHARTALAGARVNDRGAVA